MFQVRSNNRFKLKKMSQPAQHFKSSSGLVQPIALVFGFLLAAVTPPQFGLVSAAQVSQTTEKSESNLPPGLTPEQVDEGWISLFDGNSLYGWKIENDGDWLVEGGEIRTTRGKVGLLRTTTQFDDFELRLEFKTQPGTNSGVFFRTSPQPRGPSLDCFELNIAPADNPFPTGSLVARSKYEGQLAFEEWNTARIVCDGSAIRIWINGQSTCDYEAPKSLGRGFIGLQYNQGSIAFRNIALKPLNQDALFVGFYQRMLLLFRSI